jgi:hypothetical protein
LPSRNRRVVAIKETDTLLELYKLLCKGIHSYGSYRDQCAKCKESTVIFNENDVREEKGHGMGGFSHGFFSLHNAIKLPQGPRLASSTLSKSINSRRSRQNKIHFHWLIDSSTASINRDLLAVESTETAALSVTPFQ